MKDTLIMKVKQGEEMSVGFTVRVGDVPLNLSTYSIDFQVRRSPQLASEPIINKHITDTTDINSIGTITFPDQGIFQVHLLKEDTSFPIGEYYVSVAMVADHVDNIISAPPCSSGRFEICER